MLGIVSKGIIIGVLVSAPMGPIGMLCIQRTLNKGRWHGFVTGLGAALSDVIYAALTCLGMGVVVNFVEANQAPLQLIGSIVLGIFGYYIYQSNPTRNLKKHREKKLSFTQDFITAFLLTFSNVLIFLLYIGLFVLGSRNQPAPFLPHWSPAHRNSLSSVPPCRAPFVSYIKPSIASEDAIA